MSLPRREEAFIVLTVAATVALNVGVITFFETGDVAKALALGGVLGVATFALINYAPRSL